MAFTINNRDIADSQKKARSLAKSKLTRELRKLWEAIEDGYEHSEIRSALTSMNVAAEEVEKCHDLYLVGLDDTEDADATAWLADEVARTRSARKATLEAIKGPKEGTTTPSKVRLKAMDYPIFEGRSHHYQEWRNEYECTIKPRLNGASDAEISLCLRNCLSKEVKNKLAPDCKTAESILKELELENTGPL